jgi:DNA-binding response OmpR family regulator
MAAPLKTVVVLVATPALSSILSTTLAAAPSLRVRAFESEAALLAYLQVAPADLLVADFDSEASAADRLAARLRTDPSTPKHLQIIALASAVTPRMRAVSRAAGIDEVIVKPMSPRYLVERVLARLARQPPSMSQRRRDWSAFGDNIVPLFQQTPEVRPH